MSYEATIHDSQTLILRHLLFVPSAGFAELQKQTNLTSDHFNFHIKKLVETGYVDKTSNKYSLTVKGKEYANRLDTDENEIEKQPKVSVALIVEKTIDDKRVFLAQQRLKQPYYGFWGRLGGKVRWGESFEEAAARELKEETGLDGSFTFKLVFHKRDYKKTSGELLEDKVFIIMYSNDASGELLEYFEGGRNQWMSEEEFSSQEKYFESAVQFISLIESGHQYYAKEFFYDEDEY